MKNKDDCKYVYDLVSQRIKLFRKFRNLTQEELAEESNYTRGLIGNIESIKTEQTFSIAVLYAFAKVLDIPLELFFKEDISKELSLLGYEEEDEDY